MKNIDKLREVLKKAVIETFGCNDPEDIEGTVFMICEDLEYSCEGFTCDPANKHYPPCEKCPYDYFWSKEYKGEE